LLEGSGISFDELKRDGFATFPYRTGNFEEKPFVGPTGKVELYSESMASVGLDPLPAYVPPSYVLDRDAVSEMFPLVLQTGLREKTYHHSRFREQAWARKVSPDPLVHIHPETAERYGVIEGSWITVLTPGASGSCRLKARLTTDTMVDVLTTGVGWWLPEAPAPHFGARDVNINAALSYSGRWDSASGSADTRGIACRIGKATSVEIE
jgi:anaerobic selenocysteine-containing dehydrogenase